MRLYHLASLVRSKNAGPFTLTIDLVLPDGESLRRALCSERFTAATIAALYGVGESAVRICPFERVHTVKVTLPRPGSSSGAPGDADVYGCQQHFPLADLEV